MTNMIRRRPLTSFFVLAFALTGLAFIPFYQSDGEAIAWFTFGPFISALVISWIVGGWAPVGQLLRSVVRWRVNPVWYLVAIGYPVAAHLIAVWLNPLFGSVPANWANVPPIGQVAVTTAILLVFSGPLGEEPGWRRLCLAPASAAPRRAYREV